MNGCAANASPRCSSARGRTGCVYDSAYADLAVRDAELAAHAEFRKHLYAYDVVPQAKQAAAGLG